MSKLIAKKVCMLGPFAVGKTSLVRRFVESIFSDNYLTTIGVKISKKQVAHQDSTVQLMIWDIEGVDVFTALKPSNLRGAAGVLLVLDGTRPKSIEVATEICTSVREHLPDAPIIGLINKYDLEGEWKFTQEDFDAIEALDISILKTSAKTGHNVEEAFHALVEKMRLGSGSAESS
jgi:small GTP-binding protein